MADCSHDGFLFVFAGRSKNRCVSTKVLTSFFQKNITPFLFFKFSNNYFLVMSFMLSLIIIYEFFWIKMINRVSNYDIE